MTYPEANGWEVEESRGIESQIPKKWDEARKKEKTE